MKCFWGHKWLQTAQGVKSENWYRISYGCKIAGSDYNRDLLTVVEKCEKCGKERAWRGYGPGYVKPALDTEFARAEISKLNGGHNA